MDKTVYILRSVSGAGKSTLAKKLASELCIFEADKYLINKSGEYEWSPERMMEAHRLCYSKYSQYIDSGIGPLVVSNTSTSTKEFQKYIDIATESGYTVISLVVENRHGGVDSHNVPEGTLAAQERRIFASLQLRPRD